MTLNLSPARQIPSPSSWRLQWSKSAIDEVIAAHDYGAFMTSSILCEAMTRDDTLDAVLSTRALSLLGMPVEFKPPAGVPQAKVAQARDLAKLAEMIHPKACPMSALLQLVRWGTMLGACVAQIHWEVNETATQITPRLEVWHPMHLYWRWDTRSYWVNTMDGIEEVVPGTGRWLLYTPFGEERGWIHGAVRSLALVWLAREFVRRDWLRWSETFSIGIRKAIVPANADDEAKDLFHRQVASLGSETTVLLQKPDSGVGFDIDVLFPSAGDASGGFQALMDKLESRMSIRILGQNLSTEVSGGSFAAADVHYRVLQGLLSADGIALGQTLRRDLWVPWAEHNFGAASLAPDVAWRVAAVEDRAGDAATFGAMITAIASATAAGLPVDARAMLERAGIPTLPLGSAGAPTPQQGPAAVHAPPAGFVYLPTQGRAATPPGETAPPPPPPAPPPAPAATHALAATRPPPRHQVPVRRAQVDGRISNDALAEHATASATAAFKPLVSDVLAALQSGESYEAIRAKLVAAYQGSSVAGDLADETADVFMVGHLQGRVATLGEADNPEPQLHVQGRKMKRSAAKGPGRGK